MQRQTLPIKMMEWETRSLFTLGARSSLCTKKDNIQWGLHQHGWLQAKFAPSARNSSRNPWLRLTRRTSALELSYSRVVFVSIFEREKLALIKNAHSCSDLLKSTLNQTWSSLLELRLGYGANLRIAFSWMIVRTYEWSNFWRYLTLCHVSFYENNS